MVGMFLPVQLPKVAFDKFLIFLRLFQLPVPFLDFFLHALNFVILHVA